MDNSTSSIPRCMFINMGPYDYEFGQKVDNYRLFKKSWRGVSISINVYIKKYEPA